MVQPYAPGRNELDNPDFEKWARPELLHLVYNAVLEFSSQNNRLPELNSEEDATVLIDIVKQRNKVFISIILNNNI